VPRLHHLAVDPKRDVSLTRLVLSEAAVGRDRPERVEIRVAGVRVLRGDCAAPDVPADPDCGVADPELALDPAVLLVRVAAVAAAVDGEAGRRLDEANRARSPLGERC
jgi:hypothetical protein